jgi:hypothetical protein
MGAGGQAYKGDVSEVLMGHETGIFIEHGEPCGFTTTYVSSTPDFNTITFTGTGSGNSTIFENAKAILKVPVGMLIGQKISFHKTADGGGYTNHYSDGMTNKVFTIVDHTVESDATKIKVVPRFATGSIVSTAGDAMLIHSTGMPTLASGSTFAHNNSAKLSSEFSQIDQFIGLASHMKLPDTKVTMHRHHVIGLGRQAAIQQTGRVFHQGAQLEMPLNNPRWLYYSLGREVVDDTTMIAAYSKGRTAAAAVTPGQTYVDVASLDFGDQTVAIGDYILFHDDTLTPTVHYDAVDGTSSQFWPHNHAGSSLTSDSQHFEQAITSEIRRVVAIDTTKRIFLDDPLQYEHAISDGLYLFRFASTSATGSPHVNPDGTITNAVRRLLFSGDTLPSFCMEHSIRNRDVGSYSNENSNAPGSSTDSKQLTRVFRGCKVVEWELNATVDAEVKYRCIFDALSCYTDTGRLEPATISPATNPGDRYRAHRLFQNTASDATGRKESGIAVGSEKPFMFYNGTITAFGQDIGFISSFELRGKTGVEIFHTMGGTPVAESVDSSNRTLKQVPYGGTRNASIIREGREEFELEIDVIIRDSLLFHELRTHREVSGTAASIDNIIEMVFTKPTTGTTGSAPQMRIICDDYVITDAPIPVPDDKGLLHSKILIHPKNIKVISTDSLFHC